MALHRVVFLQTGDSGSPCMGFARVHLHNIGAAAALARVCVCMSNCARLAMPGGVSEKGHKTLIC